MADRLEQLDRLLASGVLTTDEHAIARRLAILNAPHDQQAPITGDIAAAGKRTTSERKRAGRRRWRLPAVIGAAAALGALAGVAALLLISDNTASNKIPATQPTAQPTSNTPAQPPATFRNVASDAAPPSCTNGSTRTLRSPSPAGPRFRLLQVFTITGAQNLACSDNAALQGVISNIDALSRAPQISQQRNDGTYVGVGKWVRLSSPPGSRARYIRYAHGGATIQLQEAEGLITVNYYYDEYS